MKLTPTPRQALHGIVCCFAFTALASATTVKQAPWGKTAAGQPVNLYTLHDGKSEVTVTNYGARITAIRVPDKTGAISNVVLTRDAPEAYTGGAAVMGATIGRYANRIAGAQLTIAGTTYPLPKNNGENTLHGGTEGFQLKVWDAKPIKDGVEMSLVSPDGDMGFPGTLTLHVDFTLQEKNGAASVGIAYTATTTKTTVINFTNHTYFNLGTDPSTPVLNDTAMIAADTYTPFATGGIPTGALDPVAGTPLDFRTARTIATGIPARGYDNNFVLRAPGIKTLAAEVNDPATGRTIRAYTTEPGLQLFVPYTAPGQVAAGPPRPPTMAFCLETQHYPDAPHQPSFPSTLLEPGKTFHSQTIYVFSAK